jgi:DNA primase
MPRRARSETTGGGISHPQKILYPAAKFAKADVVEYYRKVAQFLLPHFRNRPVTLKRYPDGVYGEAFYEKDAPGFTPEWVKTFPVPRREAGPDINYILINDLATLTWAANPGGPGVASVFASCAEDRNSDACCVRPRSRGGHEHFRLRTRRVFDARSFHEVTTRIVPESFGIKRHSGLRTAEYANHV